MSHTCPTCGTPVKVHSSDEGTNHYVLDDEAVLEALIERGRLEVALEHGEGYLDRTPLYRIKKDQP